MDTPFDISQWQPTHRSKSAETTLDPDDFQALSHKLVAQTKIIIRIPYDPQNWLTRSETWRKLKYPELALGDAHKATLLCRQHLRMLNRSVQAQKQRHSSDRDDEHQWRLGFGMGFWMSDSEPAPDDGRLKERLHGLEEKARRAEERNLCVSKEEGKGRFRPRPYPWLSLERARRSDELVEKIDRELAMKARSGQSGPLSCELRRHAFGDTGPGSRDILGVFATRDIPKGETVLVDQSRIWGCNGPGSMGDLDNLHGGVGCGDPIHPNLPEEGCETDLRWIRDETGRDASTVLMKCRLLLVAVQDEISNPLDHSLVARLTPTYNYDEGPQPLYRLTDIEIPMRALQQFGVDIFANHNFDTWVLFTIVARAENNSCGCSLSESLMPLFSLFNHSCAPNTQWFRPRGGSPQNDEKEEEDDHNSWPSERAIEEGIDHATVVVTACRDIKKGEQLFVEYDPFSHDDDVWKRRERLKKWLVTDCLCERCLREEKEVERPPATSSFGSSGRESGGSEHTTGSWDDSEPVELPEDGLLQS